MSFFKYVLFFVLFFAMESFQFASEKVKLLEINGLKMNVSYRLNRYDDIYRGALTIRKNKQVIWMHVWEMTHQDFSSMLELENEGRKNDLNFKSWVKNIFDADFGIKFFDSKILKKDLQVARIEEASIQNKITSQNLAQEILSEDHPVIVQYRAEWREDLLFLVYVKSLQQFVCYSRGY